MRITFVTTCYSNELRLPQVQIKWDFLVYFYLDVAWVAFIVSVETRALVQVTSLICLFLYTIEQNNTYLCMERL